MRIEVPELSEVGYEIFEWRHAGAILRADFPEEWQEIVDILLPFRIRKSHITVGGGGKSPIAQSLDNDFKRFGWVEKQFHTQIKVDEQLMVSPTHKVDCFKNRIAVELEWSNKDPFYDRDLNNFRLLFDLRAISVGVIITKSDSLRPVFERLRIYSKYGSSTTWMHKLTPRIEGGGGGGCPILVFGFTDSLFYDDEPA
jgi:hypothetical protein